ncbi:serine hydrolase [Verticillium dahliae]
MSTATNPAPNGTADKKQKANTRKEFKILMLHGKLYASSLLKLSFYQVPPIIGCYTQSGPLFRSKTRALEKLLAKALTPLNLTLNCIYPTAPIKLNPADIPGYQPPADDAEDTPAPDSWAWFRRRDNPSDADRPSYIGLDEGMAAIASTLRSSGPVDAVLGFSQGGAVAALVAAALETPHRDVHAEQAAWVAALREANEGRGLRFAAVYSGFFAVDESLAWCFEPKIQTPTIQFIGSLDTVVDEGRSRALVDRCEEAAVVVHPGGHYVPISKEWAMALAGYVKHHAQDPEAAKM